MEALMIGVSGMRGTIGGTLTPAVVSQMASAFAAWLQQTEKPGKGDHFRVVFGRDSSAHATVGQAVAASCAIPGYFTPVQIDGVLYTSAKV